MQHARRRRRHDIVQVARGRAFPEGDLNLVGHFLADRQVRARGVVPAGPGRRQGGADDGLGNGRRIHGKGRRIAVAVVVVAAARIGRVARALHAIRVVGGERRTAGLARPGNVGCVGQHLGGKHARRHRRLEAQGAGLGHGQAGPGRCDRPARFRERRRGNTRRVLERAGHIGQTGRDHIRQADVVSGGIAARGMPDHHRERHQIARVTSNRSGRLVHNEARLDHGDIRRGRRRIVRLPGQVLPAKCNAIAQDRTAIDGALVEHHRRVHDRQRGIVRAGGPGSGHIAQVPGHRPAAVGHDRREWIVGNDQARRGRHTIDRSQRQPWIEGVDQDSIGQSPGRHLHGQGVLDRLADSRRRWADRLGQRQVTQAHAGPIFCRGIAPATGRVERAVGHPRGVGNWGQPGPAGRADRTLRRDVERRLRTAARQGVGQR